MKAESPKIEVLNRRQAIIAAAIDYFYEYGYQKASVRDICRRVGLTQAALYYHFHNKEEILFTIIELFSNQLYCTLKSCLTGPRDPVDKLRQGISRHILSIKTDRKGAKIIIEDKRFLSGELKKLVKEKEKNVFNLYRDCLVELQSSGKLTDCDLTVATFALIGMINWLYHWYNPAKGLTLEQIADQIINILFGGLLPRGD
jgi:AcrR family transcriptional regulator